MGIRARLRYLEDREGTACPECRLKPQAQYVYYPDEAAPEPELCARCGRPLGFVIEVVYED